MVQETIPSNLEEGAWALAPLLLAVYAEEIVVPPDNKKWSDLQQTVTLRRSIAGRTYLLDTCRMIPVDPYRIHGEW
jgi:hypothetical protein